MINKFYENEKRTLEKFGAEKKNKQNSLNIEWEKLNKINNAYENMNEPSSQSSLYFQNQYQLRDKLRSIIENQNKYVDLAKLEVNNAHVDMMKQLGKVKGLEKVVMKKSAYEYNKAQKREQTMNDDISVRSFIQGNLASGYR